MGNVDQMSCESPSHKKHLNSWNLIIAGCCLLSLTGILIYPYALLGFTIPESRAKLKEFEELARLYSFHDADPNPNDTEMAADVRRWVSSRTQPEMRASYKCPPTVIIEDRTLVGPKGPFTVRSYSPPANPKSNLPVIVYFHGGGWTTGHPPEQDGYCGLLAVELSIEVLSVDYSLSPAAGPGVALEEGLIAWHSVAGRFAMISGGSSGGNLAAGIVIKLLEQNDIGHLPQAVILLFPVTDLTRAPYFSRQRFAEHYGLTANRMKRFIQNYVPDETMRTLGIYSPLYGNVSGFPPSLVLTAQFDLLRDEGRAFAQRLRDAGRLVRYRCIEGAVHAYHYRPQIPTESERVNNEVFGFIRAILRDRAA
jgi:acetyl esterase